MSAKAPRALISLSVLAAALLGSAAWVPVSSPTREKLFEIPQGTWARRMAGDRIEILPSRLHLTLGVHDVLLLRNRDDVPQTFGPTLLMPGQSFRLPFAVASEYQFLCTAHASGQMTIVVDPFPDTPWARLAWRTRELVERLREGPRPAREETPT